MNWPFLPWSCGLFTTSSQLYNSCHLIEESLSPPPGRQLLLPWPRTLGLSRFYAVGWGRQHKRQILFWLSQREGQPQGSSALLPALKVRMSPTASHSSSLLLCSHSCAWPPVSDWSLDPSSGCLSFLSPQQGLQVWFPTPGPSSDSCLVVHLTAYPPNFPVSSCLLILANWIPVSSLPCYQFLPSQSQYKTPLIPSFSFSVNLNLPLSLLKPPSSQS